jgi:hypothetical protein
MVYSEKGDESDEEKAGVAGGGGVPGNHATGPAVFAKR